MILFLISILILISSCIQTKEVTLYKCPMKCEKEKTYDKAGKCPVCKMSLKAVVENSKKN